MKEILLTKGKTAQVDDADFDWITRYSWCAIEGGAQTRIGKTRILMHVLMNPDWNQVDHKDHNPFNNQRDNLRECTSQQNAHNRLPRKRKGEVKYKGVIDKYDYRKIPAKPSKPRYYATIFSNGKPLHLGHFNNPIEAAKAYDAKARELFGEFASTNFQ